MKKFFQICFAAVSMLMCSVQASADEGMWVVGNMSARTDSILRSYGLELTPDQLYSANAPSLNDAIVMFGGFCSGVVVSHDGLVFTNHHCGFEAIQTHSTTKHDYLKYGFSAKKLKDEIPTPDLYVAFHLKTVDVTDNVYSQIPEGASAELRAAMIDSITNAMELSVEDAERCIYGNVNAFYKGSRLMLSVYQRYDDVRLVFAPPQCLGKYGGDTDNWMWPRQTCDFSVFRIYADAKNRPAEYSKKNVPFHPKKYARVSTEGYAPGSYCMTLGYPGSTDRYLSSYGIWSTMRTTNDVRYQVRGVKQEVMKAAMNSSDALRIMYASKYAQSSNYWKFSLGQNQALENLDVISEKQQLEEQLRQWVKDDYSNRRRYSEALDSLKVIYERTFNNSYAYNLWIESFYQGSDILQFVIGSMMGRMRGTDDGDFQENVKKAYKDIDIETDKAIMKVLLRNFYAHAPAVEYVLNETTQEIDSIFGGNLDEFVDRLYAQSVYANPEALAKVHDLSETGDDPMISFATDAIVTLYSSMVNGGEDEYERILGEGIREMNHDHEYYPDANFTLRLSYGLCQPINFSAPVPTGDAMKAQAADLYTTPSSFLAKHDTYPENMDFEAIDPVMKWMRSGKFSNRYIDKKSGQMQLCFLTTNDITGGNSGSGMFDGKGRLIGLAFDGNWEAMSGDLKFDNNLQRCIGVDIRWVLSVIDDYSGNKRLIKEIFNN